MWRWRRLSWLSFATARMARINAADRMPPRRTPAGGTTQYAEWRRAAGQGAGGGTIFGLSFSETSPCEVIGRDLQPLGSHKEAPLDFTRPSASALKASFKDASILTRAAAVSGNWPRFETGQRGLTREDVSFMRRDVRNDDGVRRPPAGISPAPFPPIGSGVVPACPFPTPGVPGFDDNNP